MSCCFAGVHDVVGQFRWPSERDHGFANLSDSECLSGEYKIVVNCMLC